MKDVHYRCSACSRGFKTPLKPLLAKLERGPQSCQYCRGELEYPAAFLALLANPEKEVQPWQVHCPICERPRPTERKLSEALRCKWCGMIFHAGRDPSESVRLGPADESPLVEPGEVQVAAVKISGSSEFGSFVVDVLIGRAERRELSKAELEIQVRSWSGVRTWPNRTDIPVLPTMDLTELQIMVPTLYFGVTRSFVDPAKDPPEIIIPLEQRKKGMMSGVNVAETLAIGAAGLGLLAVTGEGFLGVSLNGEGERQSSDEYRVRVTPVPMLGAFELKLANQLNTEKPVSYEPEQVRDFAVRVANSKQQVQAYLTLVALFGVRSRGQNVLRVSVDAIMRRASLLGCYRSHRLDVVAGRLRERVRSGSSASPETE